MEVVGENVQKSDSARREQLAPLQYYITRQKGTEPPFTGEYLDTEDEGTCHCVACGEAPFRSVAKFQSGTGWPSLWEPIGAEAVAAETDVNHGPRPTGMRSCINSAALKFESKGR